MNDTVVIKAMHTAIQREMKVHLNPARARAFDAAIKAIGNDANLQLIGRGRKLAIIIGRAGTVCPTCGGTGRISDASE